MVENNKRKIFTYLYKCKNYPLLSLALLFFFVNTSPTGAFAPTASGLTSNVIVSLYEVSWWV